MSDLSVFKTTVPEAIAVYDRYRSESVRFQEEVNAFKERHGISATAMYTQSHGLRLVGFSGYRNDEWPPHWRYEARRGMWVPRRTHKDGKAVAAEMDAIATFDARIAIPGMPARHLGETDAGMVMAQPGFRLIDGVLYGMWSTRTLPDGIDSEVWQPCPLSEFYKAVEADEAKAEAAA